MYDCSDPATQYAAFTALCLIKLIFNLCISVANTVTHACLSLHCAMKGVLAQTRKVRVFTVLEGATTTLWLLVQPKYASFNVCSIVFALLFTKWKVECLLWASVQLKHLLI